MKLTTFSNNQNVLLGSSVTLGSSGQSLDLMDNLLNGSNTRPAADDVTPGTLYADDINRLIYQSDGVTWTVWASLGDPAWAGPTWRPLMVQDPATSLWHVVADGLGNAIMVR